MPQLTRRPPNRVTEAARNNALWCDAVCRANGVPGAFHPSIWANPHAVPPYYPNAVTLTRDDTTDQLARVAELVAGRQQFSVKDSYQSLDLRPLGFDVLFEATWLWREAGAAFPTAATTLDWSIVTDAAGLERWEAAWAGLPSEQRVATNDRIFHPALLAEPGVYLVTGSRDAQIVAVAAANLTGEVVGLSNVFSAHVAATDLYPEVVAWLSRHFPDRPLVGYEHGEDLTAALTAGFQTTGELRVWARE